MAARRSLHATAPRVRPVHGFTLIEVLVAIGVMALVALLSWRGLDGMARVFQSVATFVDVQIIGLAIGQDERVPGEAHLAARSDVSPVLLVTSKGAVPALQLDHEKSAAGEQEDVDLCCPVVEIEERQVDPRASETVLGQQLPERVEGRRLLRGSWVTHDDPVRGV